MYTPPSFAENDTGKLYAMMQAHNFATLVSNGSPAPYATHLPFMHDRQQGEHGTLITHMARANPHWKALSPDESVLVMFQGPHSYISPRWYAAPSAVPTWNYAAVHATGKPRLIHDPARLKQIVTELVDFHEPDGLKGDFPDNLLKAIVGIEIPIEKLEGKAKFNQNRPVEDQQGVVDALAQSTDQTQLAVAAIMRENLKQQRSVEVIE